tara:strand:+ start:2501 stop:3670 length:1170 start_codon:yes stop_codon:yes gene_type:complete
MAVYKLFPSKDAAIYSAYPAMNTGLDEILEINNQVTSSGQSPRVARSLIQFDQSEINDFVDNIAGTLAISASLKGYVAKSTGVIFDSYIESYPVAAEWNNGQGKYLDEIQVQDGVSWVYSAYSGSTKWQTAGYVFRSTASFEGSAVQGGGTWYTGSGGYKWAGQTIGSLRSTQSFSLRSEKDIDLDVTDTIKVWYSASKTLDAGLIPLNNYGHIIKWKDEDEFNSSSSVQPDIKFYSVDTNTIYPPSLDLKWRDYNYETGSLSVINTPDLYVALDNNEGTFYSQSINNFRLNVRPEFPARTYLTSSLYTTNQALPSSSYYAIKDMETNEYVVEFDDTFTQISCDATGSFFKVYMNGLEPERNYKILIKTNIKGNTIILDEDYYFKVVNG